MPHAPSKNAARQGFALIVIAALFTGVAVVASVMLDKNTVTAQVRGQSDQQAQLNKLAGALTKYAMYNRRLPCPASYALLPNDVNFGAEVNGGVCDSAVATPIIGADKGLDLLVKNPGSLVKNSEMIRGMVPVAMLAPYGINPDDAFDLENNRIMYVVNRNLTHTKPTLNIASDYATITDVIHHTTDEADFVLIAYGRDKLGAIPRGSAVNSKAQVAIPCPSVRLWTDNTNWRSPVADWNCSDHLYFKKMPQNISDQAIKKGYLDEVSSDDYFDDYITSVRITCPNGTFNRSGDGQCSNVYCWGGNDQGQRGDADTATNKTTPMPVQLPRGVSSFQAVAVTAVGGSPFAMACGIASSFKDNGTPLNYGNVYCWGENENNIGAGLGSSKITGTAPKLLSIEVYGTPIYNFKATSLMVGDTGICLRGGIIDPDSNNQLYIYPNNIYPNNTVLDPQQDIYCLGYNDGYQRTTVGTSGPIYAAQGNGFASGKLAVFSDVSTLTALESMNGDGRHWCGIAVIPGNPDDKKVACWGSNAEYEVAGTGSNNRTAYFTKNTALETKIGTEKPQQIGGSGSVVLTDSGNLYAWGKKWGANNNTTIKKLGGAGADIAAPANSQLPDKAVFSHQCLITAHGKLYCRGYNATGQLGNATGFVTSPPTYPSGIYDRYYKTSPSEYKCWDTKEPQTNPQWVKKTNHEHISYECNILSNRNPMSGSPPLYQGNFDEVGSIGFVNVFSVGQTSRYTGNTCVLTANGKTYCWGDNRNGQLGIGNTTSTSTPTEVKMPAGVNSFISISNGGNTTCALAKPE